MCATNTETWFKTSNSSNNKTSTIKNLIDRQRLDIDPLKLLGLKQAAYILCLISEGEKTEDIIPRFKGDEQLVRMWMSFLLHNHWMKKDAHGELEITAKGMARI